MTVIEQCSGMEGARPATHRRSHPIGMPALVSIEMWERFSFYGMQAILVFYLYAADGLGLSKTDATAIIGAYGAFVYLATILGGWLADRAFGPERTLLGGAILVMAGHLVLGLAPGAPGAATGLCAIGIGSGFIKTCAVATLGLLYPEGTHADHHRLREQGFQLFYFGIQLGAMFGPIITGYLAKRFSWHAGFLAAAVLMAIGLSCYLALRPRMLRELSQHCRAGICQPQRPLTPAQRWAVLSGGVIAAALLAYGAGRGRLSAQGLSTTLLFIVIASVVVLFGILLRAPEVSAEERTRVIRFIPVFLACATFWSVAYQNFGVFAVYADLRLNRIVGTWELPAAWIQTLNPILVIALAFPVSWATARCTRLTIEHKMAMGVATSGAAFLLFVPFANDQPNSTPLWAMVLIAAVLALGELFIGPIGMAATAHYAPSSHRTVFSALYFLTFAVGMAASGRLSAWYHPENPMLERQYFLVTGLCTLAIAGILSAQTQRKS
ncbi:oligopeptide:H+ symporter [Staphylococcus chromogenes]|nr:oligopeptide:H+ symporter [Staphylococcus chromogenes]